MVENLDRLASLAGRSWRVSELPGGLTNRNLRVTTTDTGEPLDLVVRCAQSDAGLLGIDRDAESTNTASAAEAGVGPRVVEYRPDLGMLAIEFLPGVALDNGSFADTGVLRRAAEACRRLHAGPRFSGDFDMFARQAAYLAIVRERGFALPATYDDHADAWEAVRRALAAHPRSTVPCNNDLLAANFIDTGEMVWLIDYEYSGNNDACFELGNIWSEAALSLDHLVELMTAYDDATLRHRIARARLWGLMSKYGWTLWGSIQQSVSELDFDFWGWAMEKYDRAVAEFDGPDFERLLEEVTRAD
jgi:thiamine kinase-like enzyme